MSLLISLFIYKWSFFLNPHLWICLLNLEREGGEGRDRERGREGNMEWLPPIQALTGDQIQNLGKGRLGSNLSGARDNLRAAEPPRQDT